MCADGAGHTYVREGRKSSLWERDICARGILQKSKIGKLWQFDTFDSTRLPADEKSAVVKTLVDIIERQNLMTEHLGPLQVNGMAQARKCYLLPELLMRSLNKHNDQGCADAEQIPPSFNARRHVMIGRQVFVKGHLLSTFFRKFICKCIAVPKDANTAWQDGSVTLDSSALRWISRSWPNGKNAMAMWISQSDNRMITLKIAGLPEESYLIRTLHMDIARVLKEVAYEERVTIIRTSVGILPPATSYEAGLEWFSDQDIDQCKKSGKRALEYSTGDRTFSVPLYYFDPDTRDSNTHFNFDETRLVRRIKSDPEFVLHHRHCTSHLWPAHQQTARAIVLAVMQGHWNLPGGWLQWPWHSWKGLLDREEARKRIQIRDLAAHGDGSMKRTPCRLYVCLPSRNLYVPIEHFHRAALSEFCGELMRMFEMLRAKEATITICLSENGAPHPDADSGFHMSLSKAWEYPHCPDCPEFRVDEHIWFLLNESDMDTRTSFYGLDFAAARASILLMKQQRVKDGAAIGRDRLTITHRSPSSQGIISRLKKAGRLKFEFPQEKNLTLLLDYAAEEFQWNDARKQWE